MIRRVLQALLVVVGLAVVLAALLRFALQPPTVEVPDQTRLVFSNVTVVNPGVDRLASQTLVVDDGRIASIGTPDAGQPPSAATREYAGTYVLPGLIDMHAHQPMSLMAGEYRLWNLLYLAHGVTTVRDAGFPDSSQTGDHALSIRRDLRDGKFAGPRMFTCGQILNSIGIPPGARVVRTPVEARAAVDELAAAGVDCVKVYSHLSPETLAAIRNAAARHGLRVIGHVPLSVSLGESGLDDAQHFMGIAERVPIRRWADLWGGWSEIDDARLDAVVRESVAGKIAHTPTLVVWDRMSRIVDPAASNDAVLELLPRHWRELTWTPHGVLYFPVTPDDAGRLRAALVKMRVLLHRLHQAGVRVYVGSDATMPHVVPGAGLHEELRQFVEAGLTPEEAWVAATRHAGEWLHEPLLGTLQPGAPADFIIFRDDPSHDLAALGTLEAVVAGGRLYTKAWLENTRNRYLQHFNGALYEGYIRTVEWVIVRVIALVSRIAPVPPEISETRGRRAEGARD